MQFKREAGGDMVSGFRSIARDRQRQLRKSVSVADCSNVSRDLSALLDVEDIVLVEDIWRCPRPGSTGRSGAEPISSASPVVARKS